MKRQVLVPLDGSPLAEAILPHAATIARLTSCDLTLLQVISEPLLVEPIGTAAMPASSGWEIRREEMTAARDYLESTAGRLRAEGYTVQTELLEDSPASAIIAYARKPEVSMIAMATHGWSGLGRWMFGSVAERVLHAASRPLLIVRPHDHAGIAQPEPLDTYRTIVVPLDGSQFAEQALGWAQALASCTGATLVPVTVVSDREYLRVAEYEGGTPVTVAADCSAAEGLTGYVARTVRRLQAARIPAHGRVVEGHTPAEAILKVSEQEHADLIVMATHGRSGLQRMWMGSVALKVVQDSTAPVLLIRARCTDGNEE